MRALILGLFVSAAVAGISIAFLTVRGRVLRTARVKLIVGAIVGSSIMFFNTAVPAYAQTYGAWYDAWSNGSYCTDAYASIYNSDDGVDGNITSETFGSTNLCGRTPQTWAPDTLAVAQYLMVYRNGQWGVCNVGSYIYNAQWQVDQSTGWNFSVNTAGNEGTTNCGAGYYNDYEGSYFAPPGYGFEGGWDWGPESTYFCDGC